MNCGTHIITGGTGKYKGITGSEPFACITMPALAGPGGYTAMDIPHNTAFGACLVELAERSCFQN